MVEGYTKRREIERQDLIYLAWHTEAFARQKKLEKLETLLRKQKPKSVDNDEKLLEIAKKKGLTVPKA